MDKIIIEIDGVGRVELDASFANLDQAAQQKIVNDIAGYGKAPAETQRVRAQPTAIVLAQITCVYVRQVAPA